MFIPEAMRPAREASIDASAFRERPLWLTEWSSDSPAMIAHIITRLPAALPPPCRNWALRRKFSRNSASPITERRFRAAGA